MTQSSSNTFSKGLNEKFSASPKQKVLEKDANDQEVSRVAEGFAGETRTEVLGLDESSETNDKVSEVLSTSKDVASSGRLGGSYTSASKKEIETLRARLLNNLPSEKIMRREVEKEIRKEIKYLRNRAMGLLGPNGGMSFFEMSNLLKKIRELKGILYSLMKFSVERLRTLWLRFVHGIM
ncbi:MAG: hypothetical protein PHP74_00765 [Candidatus Gracilibacteria bacterium]|nr:hypothetical protein [Candidatus Gracilibacteria bacterium]